MVRGGDNVTVKPCNEDLVRVAASIEKSVPLESLLDGDVFQLALFPEHCILDGLKADATEEPLFCSDPLLRREDVLFSLVRRLADRGIIVLERSTKCVVFCLAVGKKHNN